VRLLESAAERPTILDVRDEGAYAKSPVRIPGSRHVTATQLQSGISFEVDLGRTVVAYCT
jgi:rhodanese-related sulfurtransferase